MNQIEHPLAGRLSQRHSYDEACDPELESPGRMAVVGSVGF
jgi:hypothetical protein